MAGVSRKEHPHCQAPAQSSGEEVWSQGLRQVGGRWAADSRKRVLSLDVHSFGRAGKHVPHQPAAGRSEKRPVHLLLNLTVELGTWLTGHVCMRTWVWIPRTHIKGRVGESGSPVRLQQGERYTVVNDKTQCLKGKRENNSQGCLLTSTCAHAHDKLLWSIWILCNLLWTFLCTIEQMQREL